MTVESQRTAKGGVGLVLGALVLLVAVARMALVDDLAARVWWYLALHAVAFVGYLLCLRAAGRLPAARRWLLLVTGVAVAARLLLLPTDPSLSGDISRYLWDGRAQHADVNPFAQAPDDPSVTALRDTNYERINHPGVSTIYPPGAQALFWLATLRSSGPFAMKLLWILFDFGLIGLIVALTTRPRLATGLPPTSGPGPPHVASSARSELPMVAKPLLALVAYALNPLVIVEVAGSGHLDGVGAFFLLLASLLIIRGRRSLSIISLMASGLVKYLALSLLPVFIKRVGWRRAALALLLGALAWLPFASAGEGLTRGLVTYGQSWRFNDSIYGLLLAGVSELEPAEPLENAVTTLRAAVGDEGSRLTWMYGLVYPRELTRLLVGLVFAAVAVALGVRGTHPLRASYVLAGLFIMLTPTLHPWYLLWVLPFAALFGGRAFWLLSGLAPLSYEVLARAVEGGEVAVWVRPVVYVPFYALLLYDALLRPGPAMMTAAGEPSEAQPTPAPLARWLGTPLRRWGLAALLLLLAVIAVRGVYRDPGAQGRVLGPDGEPADGAVLHASWYTRLERAYWGRGRFRSTYNVPDTLEVRDTPLAEQSVVAGEDGRFRLAPRWVWRGLSGGGPYLRLELEARDPLSGDAYRVEGFELADGSPVAGAYDEAAGSPRDQRATLLATLRLDHRGERSGLALTHRSGRAVTAEGSAGLRLFDLAAEPPRLLTHVPVEELGGRPLGVTQRAGFLHVFTDRGWAVLDPDTAEVAARLEGPYVAFVGQLGGNWLLLRADTRLDSYEPGPPPRLVSSLDLLETEAEASSEAWRVLVVNEVIVYLATDGSLRFWSRRGFPPDVLRDAHRPFVSIVGKDDLLYAVSTEAVLVFRVVAGSRTKRVTRRELPTGVKPVRAVQGESGLWIVTQSGCLRLEASLSVRSPRDWLGPETTELEIANTRRIGSSLAVPVLADVETTTEKGEAVWDARSGFFRAPERVRTVAALLEGWRVCAASGETRLEVLETPRRVFFGRDGDPPGMLLVETRGAVWGAAVEGGVERLGESPGSH